MIAPQNKKPSDPSDVNPHKEGAEILKALIIVPKEKTYEISDEEIQKEIQPPEETDDHQVQSRS